MTRRRREISDVRFPATAGKRSVSGSPAGAAGMLAILVALALGGCSDVWTKFTSARASSDSEKDAAMNADDDAKCQSEGFQYGTPEYTQCREGVVSKRATARDIPLGPTSAPMR
jgi:uncharacterized protein YceK